MKIPCEELFSLIPTDYGFCCSFNHDPLDAMLRGSTYVTKVMDMDERYEDLFTVRGHVQMTSVPLGEGGLANSRR